MVYTASAAHDVTSTTVTATLHNSSDTVSIMKGADTYMSGDPVLLDVGSERDHLRGHHYRTTPPRRTLTP